ncbi:O-antigen ligase family protein [uncultured Sulfitobacter sp.]|uniref:O-antigen ligase family protein n=1 Tax=uncultured Sulfitobacter sp. TaxID=191468 RepID=UPI00260B9BDF|nr:O-antigen ligase family protein [uncultured Sulfitobacter sp.]
MMSTTEIHADYLDGVAANGGLRLRITARRCDVVAMTLWFLVTFVQFRGDELLLYPLALYFALRAWQRRDEIAWLMARSLPIMMLPLWCVISPLWAVEPLIAFKTSVYLMLTMVICYVIVLSLEPRQILYAVLAATGTVAVLNLLYGLGTGKMVPGLFPHKNMLGTNMVILWAVAVAVTLDGGAPRLIRAIGMALAALSLFLIVKSQSATALVLAVATGGGMLVAALVLLGQWLRPLRLAAICIALAVISALAAWVLADPLGDVIGSVLDALGKDRSLTGRTVLWNYAEDQIREEPYLGVGSGGFWRYEDSPLVRKIHAEFYKGSRTTFNFHNSFYEIAVHQGLIGLGMTLLAMVWALGWTVRGALTLGTMPAIFFLCQSAAVTIRIFAEADFYKPFVLFHMLLWIGALGLMRQIRGRQRERAYD